MIKTNGVPVFNSVPLTHFIPLLCKFGYQSQKYKSKWFPSLKGTLNDFDTRKIYILNLRIGISNIFIFFIPSLCSNLFRILGLMEAHQMFEGSVFWGQDKILLLREAPKFRVVFKRFSRNLLIKMKADRESFWKMHNFSENYHFCEQCWENKNY